jgi:hypothetical protein
MIFHLFIFYKFRNSQPLFILNGLLFMPCFTFLLFFIFQGNISYFQVHQNHHNLSMVLNCHSLFIFTLKNFLKWDINPHRDTILQRKNYFDNNLLYSFAILAIIFIIFTGKTPGSIFETGGYGYFVQIQYTRLFELYEYGLIPILYAFIYSGLSLIKCSIIYICIVLFIIKGLLAGTRNETMQVLFLFFIVIRENRMSLKKLIVICLGIFLFFQIFGDYRATLSLDYSALIKSSSFNNTFNELIYSSSALFATVESQDISAADRIKSLILFVLSIFYPSSKMPGMANLSAYIGNFTPVGGGGLISIYFYVWFDLAGPILIGFLIAMILNNAYKVKNSYFKYYISLFLATSIRWYAYYPLAIFKFCMWGVLLGILFDFLNKRGRNRQSLSMNDKWRLR